MDFKKLLKTKMLVPLIMVLSGLAINLISFKFDERIILAIQFSGGEYIEERGFGLIASHNFPLSQNPNSSHSLSFSIIDFILTFIIFFLLYSFYSWFFEKIKEKKGI